MSFPTEEIIQKFKLFWQYPVITEKVFYKQNKKSPFYFGFPWATIIDKRYNQQVIFQLLQPYIQPGIKYYTCCQHIHFRSLISLMKALNIHLVYCPHKVLHEDILLDIRIRSCPLYAANIEDDMKNHIFKNVNYLTLARKYLYSFQGAYNPRCYLSDIRKKIFEINHPENCFIKDIGGWHYEQVVYSNKQNKDGELNENEESNKRTESYNQLLIDSRFSLCPSGSGPNSIRLWESLAVGSIPVLLADTLDLPKHELWENAIIRIPESKIKELPSILSTVTLEKENIMRENCLKIYDHFKNNYKSSVDNDCAFLIRMNDEYIKPYYTVFGHFYLDHLFQIYKLQQYFKEEYYTHVNCIVTDRRLLDLKPFIREFYNCVFEKIYYFDDMELRNMNIIDIGVIMGSPIGSETNMIYLSKSIIPSNLNLPNYVIENGRKTTSHNKTNIVNMSHIIKNKLLQNVEIFDTNKVLIVDRKTSPRKLLNIDKLISSLKKNNYETTLVSFDSLSLSDQIRLISSFKNVIVACGSVQVHISFLQKDAFFIELCESGFRYPNTSIYGNYHNINTYSITCQLSKALDKIRYQNNEITQLFNNGDKMPNVICNTIEDIEREKIFYSTLLNLDCFRIHMIQDIDCEKYVQSILNILSKNSH